MAATIEEIKALDFGYLTGADLLKFCAFQILQKQLIVDPDCLTSACDIAYSEIVSQFITKYDINTELTKTGSERAFLVVKLVAISAIKNIVANMAGVPEHMIKYFEDYNRICLAIRSGQMSLPILKVASEANVSGASVISTTYLTLG